MVVGGGPAGMEAARIAALRGHEVTLVREERHARRLHAAPSPTSVKGPHENLADLIDLPRAVRWRSPVWTVVTGTEVTARTSSASEAPDALVLACRRRARHPRPSTATAAHAGRPVRPVHVRRDGREGYRSTEAAAQAVDAALWLQNRAQEERHHGHAFDPTTTFDKGQSSTPCEGCSSCPCSTFCGMRVVAAVATITDDRRR